MLKDTEVHNGLEGKEMRNFYQETLVQYELKELANQKKREEANTLAYSEWNNKRDKSSSLRLRVRLCEIEAEYAKENLRLAECRLGLFMTMDGLNWEEHDMSDHVPKSGDRYRSFIGTKEEYEKFIEQFSK